MPSAYLTLGQAQVRKKPFQVLSLKTLARVTRYCGVEEGW